MRQIFKTTLLMTVLTVLFMAVGYMIGGRSGMLLALGFAAVSNVVTYFFSDSIVLKMQGAQPLGDRYPQVERIVQHLTALDNLPMPKLYYVDTPIPNAFATIYHLQTPIYQAAVTENGEQSQHNQTLAGSLRQTCAITPVMYRLAAWRPAFITQQHTL